MGKNKKKSKGLRSMNDIMLDMEKVLQDMTDPEGHDMQWGEVKALVDEWLEVHAPHAQETYNDGSNPVRFYGHKDYLKK